jgi:hypothetical protein
MSYAMSYSAGAAIWTIVGFILVLGVIGFSIWIVVDVIRTSRDAFSAAGSSKTFWVALLLVFAVLAFFVTAALGVVYCLSVRREVRRMMETAD